VNAVLVWHTDRLHRSPRELEAYVDLCEEHKVVTHTVKAGELDLATPSGRAVARTLGAWARFEVEHKSERTRRAQLQAAQAGKWLGGARPFGWYMHSDGSITIDRREAREVRDATRKVVTGSSLGSIVDDLNRRGVTTSTGRPWNYTSLRQMLSRARNAGLSEFHGEVVGVSDFPPIVTEDQWRAVLATLADPARRRSQSNRLKWMLAGLALCPCGSTVQSATAGGPHGRQRTVYRCRMRGAGNHVARSAEPIDHMIAEVVVERLSRPDVADLLTTKADDSGEDLREEAMALRSRISEAGDLWEGGTLTATDYEIRVGRLRARLADVEARRAVTARTSALAPLVAGDARTVWNDLTVEQRRAVVDALMAVRLLPVGRGQARVFDPRTVAIEWRQP
jgi:site-specific DNA recombinase